MDGIDAAILTSDGRGEVYQGAAISRPYDESLRADLRSILGRQADDDGVAAVAEKITLAHGTIINELLYENNITYDKIDIIGFHEIGRAHV